MDYKRTFNVSDVGIDVNEDNISLHQDGDLILMSVEDFDKLSIHWLGLRGKAVNREFESPKEDKK